MSLASASGMLGLFSEILFSFFFFFLEKPAEYDGVLDFLKLR